LVWSATGLPTGLEIDPTSGVISGTPASYSATPVEMVLTVTDNGSPTLTQTLYLTVNPAGLSISVPGVIPDANVSQPYSLQLAAVGGVAPYTWSSSGLPAGLSIDNTGLISGTPTDVKTTAIAKATLNVTVSLEDSLGTLVSQPLSLTVNPAAVVAPTPVPALGGVGLLLLSGAVAGSMGLMRRRKSS
jgi:hypothetical protein